ncbi:MAG: leucyl aminopeptidase [Bacteroidota bacterium]|nr:leucyl aminopeptidase [Bacteroidota bacterium]
MNTTIRKTTSAGKGENVAIFTTNSEKFNSSYFSSQELDFVKSEIKKKNKLISVNQYSRYVFLQIVDANTKVPYKELENLRKAGDQLISVLNKIKAESVCVVADADETATYAFLEGMLLGNYQFIKYKTQKSNNTLANIQVMSSQFSPAALSELTSVCEGVWMARDLVNEPLSTLTAVELAKAFQSMGKQSGFKVTVFDKAKIKSMKMGGLIAVNLGSIDPPTFTVMEWKPAKAKNKKPIVLVGKGVVYDTGGLSLKPTPASMDYMKSDMAGAAVVGCTMYAIAKQKLPVHVIALVPATDNRPDGNAYTPGDVVTMMSGLKVEVLNTDAEGRMILADALHYAKKYNPQLVMEFSTLTGAAANAVGHYGIVAMGDCDDAVKKELNESANHVYERLVEFPFWEEYDELIKSDIADIKNIGGAVGGAITAGRFLQRFIDYPYMHFDIAGPSFGKTNDSYRGKNGTGVGVRFMFDFLKGKAGKK